MFWVLIISGIIIAISTSAISYVGYKQELKNIDSTFKQVESSFTDTLVNALWTFRSEDVRSTLEGIHKLPYVDFVNLRPVDHSNQSIGTFPTGEVEMKEFQLNFTNTENKVISLGTLQVFVGMDNVYEKLLHENLEILKMKAIEIFLVALLLVLIFNQIVTRHLSSIASYMEKLDIKKLDEPLRLDRSTPIVFKKKDSIDMVVDALNQMRDSLKISYENIQEESNKRKVAEEKAIDYSLSLEVAYKDLFESKTRQMELNNDLSQKYQDLQVAQDKLVEYARAQGMAEVTTGILHDIGNILNNIGMIRFRGSKILTESSLTTAVKINEMLSEQEDVEKFLNEDSKGKKVLSNLPTIFKGVAADQEELNEQMGKLEKSVKLMTKIIERQQNYAKSQYSFHKPKTELLDINKIITDSIELNKLSFDKYDIEIMTDLSELPQVECIYHEIYNIIANIMKNAKEAYMSKDFVGDRKTLEISSKLDDKSVRIEIKDNAIGIAKDNLEKVFEKGFSDKEDGHGFGLHTCRKSVRSLGGELWAESEGVGKGTTFVITLPIESDVKAAS